MKRAIAREIMSSPVITMSPRAPFLNIVAIMLQDAWNRAGREGSGGIPQSG